MEKEKLEILKRKLPRGYGKILQQRTGKSLKGIYMALSGEFHSEIIIKAAINLVDEIENENKDYLEKQKRVLENTITQ